MKPISINLASRPFYNQTLYLVAFAVSTTLLLVMTGLNLYTFLVDQAAWSHFREARAEMQVELKALDRQAIGHERILKKLNLAQVTAQSSFANDAILQRVFSWTLLFNRLEDVIPPTVKLISIRPLLEDGSIHFRVIGISKNSMAFTEFEENLLKSPLFSEVYPISERSSNTGRGVDFGLSFRYLSGDTALPPGAAMEPGASAEPPSTDGSAQEEPSPGATRASSPGGGEPVAPPKNGLESSS